jgi:putative flippase GtrA
MSQLPMMLGSCLKITNHLALKLASLINQKNSFIKFLLVGLLNTIVGLGFMFFLKNGFNLPYWVATFTGNTLGAVVSFLLNRSFTFTSCVPIKEGVPRFAAVIIICYLFSFSISRLLAESLTDRDWQMNLISNDSLAILLGTGIYTISNYLGQKWYVFKKGAA